MRTPNSYRINQAINLIKNRFDLGLPLKWVYIYGHHRGGTSYTLQQFMKIAKRGTGDWMMHQFAEAYIAAERRERQKLDMVKLKRSFRRNLLANAHLGGGQAYDIVLKQAVGTQDIASVELEISFFTELFKAKPSELLFLYREPSGYWRSAKKKFGHDDDDMFVHYSRALETYKLNGGRAIEYGKELNDFIVNHPLLQKVKTDNFDPKPTREMEGLDVAIEEYQSFKNYLNKESEKNKV